MCTQGDGCRAFFNAFGRMIFAAFGVGCAQLQKSRLSAVCRAGSTLRSLGRFKKRCQLIRRHKTHRLTLPSHISRRSRRPKRKVVARDGFGAFNVTEPFKRPSIQSAFLPAFFHGICREGQPGLQPTFGKSRLHSAELIGRVDQPDTPIGFNDDKALVRRLSVAGKGGSATAGSSCAKRTQSKHSNGACVSAMPLSTAGRSVGSVMEKVAAAPESPQAET